MNIDFSKTEVLDESKLFLDPEDDRGPIEYKYTLQLQDRSVWESRASQLHFRIQEGNGLATFYLGVCDNGYQLGLSRECLELSINSINEIMNLIDAECFSYQLFQNDFPVEQSFKQLFLSYNLPISSLHKPSGSLDKEFEKTEPIANVEIPISPLLENIAQLQLMEPCINTSDPGEGSSLVDNGDDKSYQTPQAVRELWVVRTIPDHPSLLEPRFILKMEISRKTKVRNETRIVILGQVDAGKSSLVGVLTTNKLDNGNGSARAVVFNHPHEMQRGQTSSIGHRLLGLDKTGRIINDVRVTVNDLVEKSDHLVSLIDLAGHLKYLNTTVRGVCGHYPDNALIVMEAKKGVPEMTREHIILAYLHKIPITIVVTKIDVCTSDILAKTLSTVKGLLKSVNYNTIYIKSQNELEFYKKQRCTELVPIFTISNVKGTNIDLLTHHIHTMPKHHDFAKRILEPLHASINETFLITGVGTVVSVIILAGQGYVRQSHWIGPFKDSSFRKVIVKSIQYKRTNVQQAFSGQSVTFALRGIERREIEKGMVLIDGRLPCPSTSRRFKAEITIVGRHSTSIREFYEPVVNVDSTRQVVKILKITDIKSTIDPKILSKEQDGLITETICLRSGDSATVEMEFKYNSVYLRPGALIMFREQKVKGYGTILEVL